MGILNINSAEDAMVAVVTMGSEGSLVKAIRLMNAGDLECIVITEIGDPVGILTKRDIIRLVAQDTDVDRVPVKARAQLGYL